MIPLAQYFAQTGGEDFTPFQPAPVRKAPAVQQKRKAESLTIIPAPAVPPARPLKAAGHQPGQQQRAPEVSPRPVTEPRVTLREVEAERAAWAAEREAQVRHLDAAVDAARRAGIEAGRALARGELEAETDSRIEAVRLEIANDHDEALLKERAGWTEKQADRLADLLILQVAILEETIKASLATVLRPLALDMRRRQSVDDIVGAVRTLALDGGAYRIAASGPTDLLSALEDRLGDHAKLLSFEADDTQADIRIAADNTVIETRLSSWRLALEEALS